MGWGLTHNNTHLICSDGSNRLLVADQNMQLLETIEVKDQDGHAYRSIN